jgi:hypothetical protein
MGKSASLKEIESYLHPYPVINGLQILHRHLGSYIYFDAWNGDNKANNKEVRVHRDMVLMSADSFYEHEAENLKFLTE